MSNELERTIFNISASLHFRIQKEIQKAVRYLKGFENVAILRDLGLNTCKNQVDLPTNPQRQRSF